MGRLLGSVVTAVWLMVPLACGGEATQRTQTNELGQPEQPESSGQPDAVTPCPPEPLSNVCDLGGCPASPDELTASCDEGVSVNTASTSCGGTIVTVGELFGSSTWFFDAGGTLVGGVVEGDEVMACSDGPELSGTRVFGVTCPASGPAVDQCRRCNAPPLECAPGECPSSEQDLTALCHDKHVSALVEMTSLCGGKMVRATFDDREVEYCFDASGGLTAITSRFSTGEKVVLGEPCFAGGELERLCFAPPR